MKTYALGMIETVGLISLITALDEAVKAEDVQVIKYEKAELIEVMLEAAGDQDEA